MNAQLHLSLKDYNTFGIDVKAKNFFAVQTEEDLLKVLKKCYADELFILGGGSNILLTQDIDQTVLHINLKGISIINENDRSVIIRAQAGENWHEFVRYCVANDFGGLENLSLIPGNVGTAPIQNIGAYGVEMQDCFVECEAIHRQTLEKRIFEKQDCHFGYRDSIFKHQLKNQYIITSVVFKLTKKHHHYHTSYGSLQQALTEMNVEQPTLSAISDAIISIRQHKLPDPADLGSSGSFFKNPIITASEFQSLKTKFPQIKFYKINENRYKIPAGWLIDQAGFKGFREGDAGVHQQQALVLVNHDKATGKDILNLAQRIQDTVKSTYGIFLEMEVNVIP